MNWFKKTWDRWWALNILYKYNYCPIHLKENTWLSSPKCSACRTKKFEFKMHLKQKELERAIKILKGE